jgi:hypothetical protein
MQMVLSRIDQGNTAGPAIKDAHTGPQHDHVLISAYRKSN